MKTSCLSWNKQKKEKIHTVLCICDIEPYHFQTKMEDWKTDVKAKISKLIKKIKNLVFY